MTEKQPAQTFSGQVDDLLAGRTPLDEDPLLSLAAEMAAGPAMDPSPAFVQRLRCQLLLSLPRERTVRSHRRWWSFAGVAATLLLALALALVWNPGPPSAAEVLARAADAIAIEPGQIVYDVVKLNVERIGADNFEGMYFEGMYSTIQEDWGRAGTMPDGRLTSVEIAGTIYRADDTNMTHPLIQHYSTLSKLCMRSLDPSIPIPPRPDLDDEGCIALSIPAGSDSDPMAIYAGESFQDWISRMRANAEEIEFHEGRFNGHPVYGLTYREAGHQTQSLVTVTIYIDRETYLPVGVISAGPNMVGTQTILKYQVLDPTDIDFDPFVWPPEQ